MFSQETYVTEFDFRTTNGATQLIKAIIPFLPPTEQKLLAVITRIGELIMTLKFFEHYCFENDGKPFTANLNPDTVGSIRRYCTPKNQEMLDMILKFMNMSELMNIMNAFGSDVENGANNPFSTFQNTTGATPDTANIMNLFKSFSQFTSPFENDGAKNSGGSDAFSDTSVTGADRSFTSRAPAMDPAQILKSMMKPEQNNLYQEFMAKLDANLN